MPDASDIRAAYDRRREIVAEQGNPMERLVLEDAFMRALAQCEADAGIETKAIQTDQIFDELTAVHIAGEPFTDDELQMIARKIMRVLYNPWNRASKPAWKQIIELGDGGEIKDNQFDEILREALLRYFGYYNEGRAGIGQSNKAAGPRLMPPSIAQYIFDKAGWIDFEPRSVKEKQELQWLREELDVDASYDKKTMIAFSDTIFVIFVLIAAVFLFFKLAAWAKAIILNLA